MNRKGITAIEILIILCIVGIMAALIMSRITPPIERQRCHNLYSVAKSSHDSLVIALNDQICSNYLKDSISTK